MPHSRAVACHGKLGVGFFCQARIVSEGPRSIRCHPQPPSDVTEPLEGPVMRKTRFIIYYAASLWHLDGSNLKFPLNHGKGELSLIVAAARVA